MASGSKGRRNRAFAFPEPQSETTGKTIAGVLENQIETPGEDPLSMLRTYITPEGIIVKVYTGNILKLDVECIVNAANEHLSHGGGVAAVISRAAGYQFDQESSDYVREHGQLAVGTCCATSAGKLNYKYVIHAVGPRWHDYNYDEKKQCADDLRQAIVCSFGEAENLQLKSIALPAISSGIFGVPKEYMNAVMEFSKGRKSGTCLGEIHFIDKDVSMIKLIQEKFNQNLKPFTQTTMHGVSGLETRIIMVRSDLKLAVKIGDITKLDVDAIVCPQEEFLIHKGAIAREVDKIAGSDYTRELNTLRLHMFGAKRMNAPMKCPWKYVIQTVPPILNRGATAYSQQFERKSKETIYNVLQATIHSRIKTMAIPLLGKAEKRSYYLVKTFAEQFVKAVLKQLENKDFSVNEINIVVHDAATASTILEVLSTYKKKSELGPTQTTGRDQEAKRATDEYDMKMAKASSGIECDICKLRNISNPASNWCSECGESICSECNEHHRLANATRSHKTISISDYQNLPSAALDIKHHCEVHDDKLEFYCPTHASACCVKCIEVNHHECRDIKSLREAIKDIKSSAVLVEFENNLSEFLDIYKRIKEDKVSNSNHIEQQASSFKEGILQLKRQFDSHLDELVKAFMSSLESNTSNCKDKLSQFSSLMDEKTTRVKNTIDNITKYKQHASELQTFLGLAEIEKTIHEERDFIRKIGSRSDFTNYDLQFQVSPAFKSLKASVTSLGSIKAEKKKVPIQIALKSEKQAQEQRPKSEVDDIDNVTLTKAVDINIRKDAVAGIRITGCDVIDNKIILANERGKELLMYTDQGKFEDKIELSFKPFDICHMNNQKLVISSGYSESIYIYDMESRKIVNQRTTTESALGLQFF